MSKTFNIGDRVSLQPVTFGEGEMGLGPQRGCMMKKQTYPGTVTYINAKRGWYQVTFDNGVKECFFFPAQKVKKPKETYNRSRLYTCV